MKLGSNYILSVVLAVGSSNASAHKLTFGEMSNDQVKELLGDEFYLNVTTSKMEAIRLKEYCDKTLKPKEECAEEFNAVGDVFGGESMDKIILDCTPKPKSYFGKKVELDPTLAHEKQGIWHSHYYYDSNSDDPDDQYRHRHVYTDGDRDDAERMARADKRQEILSNTESVSISNGRTGKLGAEGGVLVLKVGTEYSATDQKTVTTKTITPEGEKLIDNAGLKAREDPAAYVEKPGAVCYEHLEDCITVQGRETKNEAHVPHAQTKDEENKSREKAKADAEAKAAKAEAENETKKREEEDRKRREAENNKSAKIDDTNKVLDPNKKPVTVDYEPKKDEYYVSFDPEIEGSMEAGIFRACVDQKVRESLAAPKRVDPNYDATTVADLKKYEKTDEMISRYDNRFEELDLDDRKCLGLPLTNEFNDCQELKNFLWTTEAFHNIQDSLEDKSFDKLPETTKEKRRKELEGLMKELDPKRLEQINDDFGVGNSGGVIIKPGDSFKGELSGNKRL